MGSIDDGFGLDDSRCDLSSARSRRMRSGLDASRGGSGSHLSPRAAAVRPRAASRSRSEGALLSRPAALENGKQTCVRCMPVSTSVAFAHCWKHGVACVLVCDCHCMGVCGRCQHAMLFGRQQIPILCLLSFLSQQPTSHGQVLSQERTLVGPQAR